MLLGRQADSLGSQHVESTDDALTGLGRFDNIIDIAELGSNIRVVEVLFVFRNLFLGHADRIRCG